VAKAFADVAKEESKARSAAVALPMAASAAKAELHKAEAELAMVAAIQEHKLEAGEKVLSAHEFAQATAGDASMASVGYMEFKMEVTTATAGTRAAMGQLTLAARMAAQATAKSAAAKVAWVEADLVYVKTKKEARKIDMQTMRAAMAFAASPTEQARAEGKSVMAALNLQANAVHVKVSKLRLFRIWVST
jgi:hypothetical protein